MRRLYSARRFLECCSPEWQHRGYVCAVAGLSGDGSRQVSMLEDGLIEVDGDSVRLTDAGVLAVMHQSPSSSDLYDATMASQRPRPAR